MYICTLYHGLQFLFLSILLLVWADTANSILHDSADYYVCVCIISVIYMIFTINSALFYWNFMLHAIILGDFFMLKITSV